MNGKDYQDMAIRTCSIPYTLLTWWHPESEVSKEVAL